MPKEKVRALVLLSGGLDSMLAVKVLQDQDIEVVGISFASNFFNTYKAEAAAKQLSIKLIKIDISQEILALVKNPSSGHGKNLNPCIDCHSLMMRKAVEHLRPPCQREVNGVLPHKKINPFTLLYQEGMIAFIATGEVLGQRPFSQNKKALARVQNLAGLEVLRPLSAKLLPETEIEKRGLVDRQRLLDINGRQHDRQMSLAKQYGLTAYPAPAGGCLLTEPDFSKRLGEMISFWPDCEPEDVEILSYGRNFWLILEKNFQIFYILVIIGRQAEENERLKKLAKKGDFMLELKEIKGPTSLVRIKNINPEISSRTLKISVPVELKTVAEIGNKFKNINEIIYHASVLTGYYSSKTRGKTAKVNLFLSASLK